MEETVFRHALRAAGFPRHSPRTAGENQYRTFPGLPRVGIAGIQERRMGCPNCGADVTAGAAFCQYCGSALPRSEGSEDRLAVIERVKRSPEYQQRNSAERIDRLPKYQAFHKAFMVVFFTMFIGVAVFISLMMLGMSGVFGFLGFRGFGGHGALFSVIPLMMAVVPIAFIAIGVLGFNSMRKKMASIETSPVEAVPAVVVDKRTQVSGGGDSSARTSYFVTCETENGDRSEYQLWDGKLYGSMSAGDAGVLFLRAGYALGFDRVAS